MTWWLPTATSPLPPRLLAPLAALLLAATAPGCGPSRAELEGDRAKLRAVLERDAETSRVLHQADQAMAVAKLDEAQRLVVGQAKPAASENARRAEELAAATDWGKARRGDLHALLRDRAASLDEYAAAMASGDAQRVVDALERQRDIERRALELTQSLAQLP